MDDTDYFIPTRGSVSGSKSYSCVVHTLPKPQSKKSDSIDKSLKIFDKTVKPDVDPARAKIEQNREMKKLRFELYKFAQTSLEAKDKFVADKELAIRLGAARPKREFKNYKELKLEREKRKQARIKAKEEARLSQAVMVDPSTYDPYRKKVSATKKFRNSLKKGEIGGMLKNFGEVHNKIKKHKSKILR